MPTDMKRTIADAAIRLLTSRQTKKLTVKDIVNECHITRQAFYYHFEDIPALFQWMLDKSVEELLQQADAQKDPETRLFHFFFMAIHLSPYIKKGMQGSYRSELEQLLTQYLYRLFEQTADREEMFSSYSRPEVSFILRYHVQAIIGLLREWNDKDTKNLNQIVHLVHLLLTGNIHP